MGFIDLGVLMVDTSLTVSEITDHTQKFVFVLIFLQSSITLTEILIIVNFLSDPHFPNTQISQFILP